MHDVIKTRMLQDAEADKHRLARDAWILTFTGARFSLSAPRWDEVDIVDITMALSRQCRFNGHTRSFYSVAQHSVLVARELPERLRLHGLLHDAHEAYLGDTVRPLKQVLHGGPLTVFEERIDAAIAARFALGYPPLPDEVGDADRFLLAVERRDLLPRSAHWPAENISFERHAKIEPLAPGLAAIQFAREYIALTGDRGFPEEFFEDRARDIP